eukprot:Rmarinus@m.12644
MHDYILVVFITGAVGYLSCLVGSGLQKCLSRVLKMFLRPPPQPSGKVRVNCHFCCQDTYVDFENENRWYCPSCDQYNGFTDDGDYDRPLPELYDPSLNRRSHVHPTTAPINDSDSVLCPRCTRSLELQVYRLSTIDEENEDEFRRREDLIRRSTDMCEKCKLAVSHRLQEVDHARRARWLATRLSASQNEKYTSQKSLQRANSRVVHHAQARRAGLLLWQAGWKAVVALVRIAAECGGVLLFVRWFVPQEFVYEWLDIVFPTTMNDNSDTCESVHTLQGAEGWISYVLIFMGATILLIFFVGISSQMLETVRVGGNFVFNMLRRAWKSLQGGLSSRTTRAAKEEDRVTHHLRSLDLSM